MLHQTCGRTSAGDPSETPRAYRGAAVVEAEAAAERGLAVVPERCCSGWPSSASGAGRTAPESRVETSHSGTLVVLPLLLARTGTGAPGVHHLI